jgi:hypothetical protein
MEKVITKTPPIERFPNATKRLIVEAIKEAIIEGNNEREATKSLYSEEALRYIVAKHISQLKIFGTFPNRASSKTKLVFEMEYHRLKTKESKYKPDIASVTYDKSGNIAHYNLAAELKITPSIDDIKKCRNYISLKHGRMTFKLALCIVTTSQRGDGVVYKIPDKIKGTITNSNLLFCSIEKTKSGIAPVVIWIKD